MINILKKPAENETNLPIYCGAADPGPKGGEKETKKSKFSNPSPLQNISGDFPSQKGDSIEDSRGTFEVKYEGEFNAKTSTHPVFRSINTSK